MPAIVMNCTKKESHPNANTLFVYEFSNGFSIQIVANLENVYEIGDKVIVVLQHSTMKDGTKIRVSKLRGIRSYGMAIGKTDLPVGTDVTEEYCEEEVVINGFSFKSFPDIGQLFNVRKDMKDSDSLMKVDYRPKIKLHGTNASVRVATDGRIAAQSRERLLPVDNDNYGFASWVEANEHYFSTQKENIIIHGEWCGQGIGGLAIRSIDKKIFAVFAVQLERPSGDIIIYEPELISNYVKPQEDVYIIPWASPKLSLNYEDKVLLKKQASTIDASIIEIGECDPWVKEVFSCEGRGEGLVMYPILDDSGMIGREDFSEFLFKAKTEEHRVVKTKTAVEIDPAVAKSIDEFVELFSTEARFNQIATAVGGDFHQKFTGNFVKGFTIDVKKESVAELEASGLDWKQVGKQVSRSAAQWWSNKCKEI